MRVLAGDIGGTNARLAVYEIGGGRFHAGAEEVYPSRQYASLAEIIRHFMDGVSEPCQRACFGVPGPVRRGKAEITNLPWVVEAAQLVEATGIDAVYLLNDMEAQAYGIATLGPDDFLVLNPGDLDAVGNAALIAAGTGLGQAGLYWDGQRHRPFACEGGHTSFAPQTELQVALLDHLRARFGHVSWERVLSGPGFVNIHDFLIDYRHSASPPAHVDELRKEDPARITESALAGRCPLCVESLDLFLEFYGAEAGNLALKFLAAGGVYLGGGIAPKIAEKLNGPEFMEAFLGKGRMRPLLEAMPVRVILHSRTALRGAASYAAEIGEAP